MGPFAELSRSIHSSSECPICARAKGSEALERKVRVSGAERTKRSCAKCSLMCSLNVAILAVLTRLGLD